ncbi:MAG: hypothetical protein Q9211_002052 [Gyalolechia sp. 1 TL-2023]
MNPSNKPLTVWIKSGLCTLDSLINILLCTLGFIPGLLHAWYIIAKYPDPSSSGYEDLESGSQQQHGHVTYYYVSDTRNNGQGDLIPTQQQYPSNNRGYGTVQQPQPQPQSKQPGPAGAHSQQQQQQQQQGQQGTAGEGSSGGQAVPPSYEQAISGDNKAQT